jgi:glucose-1-phosphate cytidylyltransferase
LARLEPWLRNEPFLLTYGDGVSNVPIDELIRGHNEAGRVATVTAVRPPSRFGGLRFDGPIVTEFVEKPQIGEGWINGGFMVFSARAFEYVNVQTDSLERDVLERLADVGQLSVHSHEGFWQCMDTLRDKLLLEDLWNRGQAEWKLWA